MNSPGPDPRNRLRSPFGSPEFSPSSPASERPALPQFDREFDTKPADRVSSIFALQIPHLFLFQVYELMMKCQCQSRKVVLLRGRFSIGTGSFTHNEQRCTFEFLLSDDERASLNYVSERDAGIPKYF